MYLSKNFRKRNHNPSSIRIEMKFDQKWNFQESPEKQKVCAAVMQHRPSMNTETNMCLEKIAVRIKLF